MKKYLVATLDKNEVYIDLEEVLEATTVSSFRVAPGSKNYVKGIMDYRNKLIPIIDITNSEVKESLIIIKHEDTVFGFAVENIIGIDLRKIQDFMQETDNPFILKAFDVSKINVSKIVESIL